MKIITSVLFFLLLFVPSSSLFASNKTMLKKVQDMLGKDIKIEKIEKKHGNFYTAFMDNGMVLYVDVKNRLIFDGNIFHIDKNKYLTNLSQEDKSQWMSKIEDKKSKSIDVAELKSSAVLDKMNGGSSTNEIVMFDSPTCYYCKKVNKFFKKEKYKLNIYRIYADTRYTSSILKKEYKVKNTSVKIAKMSKMAQKHNVTGTPLIMVLKKDKVVHIIRGANFKEIKQWLKK